MSGQRSKRGGSKSASVYRAMAYVYGEMCLKCGSTNNLHVDHVVPLSSGGPDTFENLQFLCGPCNMSKSTKTADYRPRLVIFSSHPDRSDYIGVWAKALRDVNYERCVLADKVGELEAQVAILRDRLGEAVDAAERARSVNRSKWSWWPFKLTGVTA